MIYQALEELRAVHVFTCAFFLFCRARKEARQTFHNPSPETITCSSVMMIISHLIDASQQEDTSGR
jgi:hypothetical protein